MSLMAASFAKGFVGEGGVLGRAGPVVGALAALAPLALLAAACSGAQAGPGVAQVSSKPSASQRSSGVVAFAACMRSHGVPNFPDPGSQLPAGIDPNSSGFQAAQKACQSLLPQGSSDGVPAADQARFLKFSACMRTHGVPNFPDPDFSGGGARIQVGVGLDPSSPQFQAAQKACQHYLPGGGPRGGIHRVEAPGGGAP